MAATTGLVDTYRRDVLRGKHREDDVYCMAIYDSQADLHPSRTTQYTPAHEVQGEGYPRGGIVLKGFKADLYGAVATLDFDNPVIQNASITGRAILIYNRSLPGKDAVYIGAFEKDITSVNGPWTPGLPTERGAKTSLIQW